MPSAVAPTPLRRPRHRHPGGFTLLETVVAMAIFAASSMALYALFNSNLIALGRVQDVSRQLPAAYRAIEYLSALNPGEESSGQFELDGFNIAWSSRLLEPVRQSQTAQGYRGYHEVGLYEVEFRMSRDGGQAGTYRMRLVGHEQVRWPALD